MSRAVQEWRKFQDLLNIRLSEAVDRLVSDWPMMEKRPNVRLPESAEKCMPDTPKTPDTCTWYGCYADAAHPRIAADGVQWANLCDAHHAEFDAAENPLSGDKARTGGVGSIISAWVKAQGGPKRAAARMTRSGSSGVSK